MAVDPLQASPFLAALPEAFYGQPATLSQAGLQLHQLWDTSRQSKQKIGIYPTSDATIGRDAGNGLAGWP